MSEIIVREARKEDLEAIAEMVARLKVLNEELDPNFKVVENLEEEARKYAQEVLESDSHIVLVAEDKGKGRPAGLIIARLLDRRFYKPRLKALITDFYVKPLYRRKRLGTLLMEKLVAEARRRGAGIVTAVFPSNNKIAEEFYTSHGFRDLQTEKYKQVD